MDCGKAIDKFIDSHRDEMVSDLRRLVSIPSVAAQSEGDYPFGKNVARALYEALSIGEKLGLKCRNLDNYAGLFDVSGQSGETGLGVLCHIDVVPAGDGWKHDPFAGEIEDGIFYGRGAIDDKGPAVCALYALAAVKSCGIEPATGARVILGTNEENGSSDMRYCESKGVVPDMLFSPDADYPIVNIEKGLFRCTLEGGFDSRKSAVLRLSGGDIINMVPSRAEAVLRGVLPERIEELIARDDSEIVFSVEAEGDRVSVRAQGETAHASTPELGKNALTALVSLLAGLEGEDGSLSIVRELARLFPHGEFSGESAGIDASDRISGALTVNFSILNINDGNVCAKADVRFPVCESLDGLEARLKRRLEGGILKLGECGGSEPHYVPEEGRLVSVLKEVYQNETGQKAYCRALGGATYVHHSPGGVAFGPVFPGCDNRLHASDEFIAVDQLISDAKMYAKAILKLITDE